MARRRPLSDSTRRRRHFRRSHLPCRDVCQSLYPKLPHLMAHARLHQFGPTRRSAIAQQSTKTCSSLTWCAAEEGCSTTARRGEQRLGTGPQAASRRRHGRLSSNRIASRLSLMLSVLARQPAALLVLQAARAARSLRQPAAPLVLQAARMARLSNAQPDDRVPSALPLVRQKALRCKASNKVRPRLMFNITSSTWTSAETST